MIDEFELVKILIEKQLHICTAESCTGGLLAAAIVNVPDASTVLNESYVTYSQEAKSRILGVSPAAIADFGVVSEEVAARMAAGAARVSGADVGVGITGYAGPSGGDRFAPRGTVCIGFSINGLVCTEKIFRPELSRNDLRRLTVEYTIHRLGEILQNS